MEKFPMIQLNDSGKDKMEDLFKMGEPKWSIILPVSNEEELIFDEVRKLIEEFRKLEEPFEILICENGSKDRTLEIARQLEMIFREVRVLVHNRPSYGMALKMGIEEARGEWLVVFNIDLWDVNFVKRAMERLGEWEFVLGSKLIHGSEDCRPTLRRMITKGFNLFLNFTTGLKSTDTHGMKVIKRERTLPLARACVTEGWTFDTELVIRAEREGIKIVELPVRVVEKRPPRYGLIKRVPRTAFLILKMLIALKAIKS
jgi:glycosyltransferase involved in cell wall biosynthesis